MKKFLPIAILLFGSLAAHAEDLEFSEPFRIPQEYISMFAVIFVIYLIMRFILAITKMIMDHRVKDKLLEKDVPESLVTQYLQPNTKGPKNETIKWVTTFLSIGIGLLLVSWTSPPFGLHSLAIMAFSVAGGFWAYNYFSRRANK
jgi:hypothetical protein